MIFSLRRWAMFIKNTQNEKLNKSFATDFSNNLILIFIGSVLNKNPNFINIVLSFIILNRYLGRWLIQSVQ